MFQEGDKIQFQPNGFGTKWFHGVFVGYITDDTVRVIVDGKTKYIPITMIQKEK